MTVDLKSALLRDFKSLYERLESNDDHNVTIKVGQSCYKAHSVILKARSEYLRNGIDNEYKKRMFKRSVTLEIPNISPSVFKICLKYIYTGEFSLQEHENEFIFDLIVAANELNLVDMVDCLQIHFISKKTSWVEQNLIRVYQTSMQLYFEKLKTYCETLVDDNPALLFNSELFPTLQKTILLDLIKRDDLYLPEITIWRSLIKWGVEQEPSINELDFDKLEGRIRDLVPHIRFFTIPSGDHYDYVLPYKKVIPKGTIGQLKSYYYKGILPSDALPPRRLKTVRRYLDNPVDLKPSTNYDEQNRPNRPLARPPIVIFPRNPSPSPVDTPRTPSPPPIDNEQQFSRIVDFRFGSTLINKPQIKRISRWIDGFDNSGINNNPNSNFFLLARGSRDGMTRETFHSLCDNKGPTIILAKVEETMDIIGGYNPKSWTSKNKWIETTESFIFSFKSDGNREGIDDVILSRIKDTSTTAAIWDGDNSYDVWFGSDLQLFTGVYNDKCESYSKKIMNGNNFNITEYEVFQVKKLNH